MSNPKPSRALAVILAAAALATGCGSVPAGPQRQAALESPPALSLSTTLVTSAGTWAVTEMGGSAARHNNFWQLFVRPAGSSQWKLVTPPGTADNGGLVLASSGPSLITAFLPSQYLTFTPLAQTSSGGQAWASLSPLGAALASTPDALAAQPGSRRLLALLASGAATLTAPGAAPATLTTLQALAATPAGQRCSLQALTAIAVTAPGTPLLAGACARPGTAGIFAERHGTWQAAGPALPPALADQPITVLSLTSAAQQTTALLAAGSSYTESILTARTEGDNGRWTLSPALSLHGAVLTSASIGPGGAAAIILAGSRGELITSTASQWRAQPALPAGTATLAIGPGTAITALAVSHSTLTIWQANPGATSWTTTQAIIVPIQYGSSG